jgi:hypothetical protein
MATACSLRESKGKKMGNLVCELCGFRTIAGLHPDLASFLVPLVPRLVDEGEAGAAAEALIGCLRTSLSQPNAHPGMRIALMKALSAIPLDPNAAPTFLVAAQEVRCTSSS